jgi:hypothetical protein
MFGFPCEALCHQTSENKGFETKNCGYRRAVKDRGHRSEVKIKEHRRNFKTKGKGGR